LRAWILENFGGIDSLRLIERPALQPGPGEALVRIRAAALNYRDLVIMRGDYGPGVRLPVVPGCDGAGEVVQVGPGVTRVRPGQRVVLCLAPAWLAGPLREEYLRELPGSSRDGMLAELVTYPADALVPVPGHLSWEEAATLPCAALTAWNALIASGNLHPGETVLVMGSGGVAVFALQFARLAGAQVIVISSSDEKLARLRKLGASAGINYVEVPEWGKRVREMTAGRGVDHVVELGGAGTMEQSTRAVRVGGTISLIGVLAGPGQFHLPRVLMKAIRVQGIFGGSREMFEAMNQAIEAAGLRPIVDRVFAFEELPTAYRYFESRSHVGKVVIRVS